MITNCTLPDEALTQRYLAAGEYTDCYLTEIARPVTHAEFVEAFYTTGLFKLERWILRRMVAKPSSDREARELARGERDSFAAWTVEARAPDQILLRDFTGRTCSWLMVRRFEDPARTQLFFGSVVIRMRDVKTGQMVLGPVHGSLMAFHKVYSRLLLKAAARRLA